MQFSYRGFLDMFWPTDGRQPQRLSESRRQLALAELLKKIHAQMSKHAKETGSDRPAER
eukprot:SAG22_NODE_3512_length_1670_cov_1.161680_3_plen_59_part_00